MVLDELKIQYLYQQIVQENSLKAFNSLYDLLYIYLYNFALKITRSREISEEVVADVFTNFWIDRDKHSKIKNVVTYLYVAIRNRALNEIEKERRRENISLEDITVEIAEYRCNPELEYISNEEVDKINRAMEQLSPRCKMVLVLSREHNLKYKEVAEVMGISEKTVETQISRALKKMAETLGISMEDTGKKNKLLTYMLCL